MVVMEDEGNKVKIGLRNIINKLHDMGKKGRTLAKKLYVSRAFHVWLWPQMIEIL